MAKRKQLHKRKVGKFGITHSFTIPPSLMNCVAWVKKRGVALLGNCQMWWTVSTALIVMTCVAVHMAGIYVSTHDVSFCFVSANSMNHREIINLQLSFGRTMLARSSHTCKRGE